MFEKAAKNEIPIPAQESEKERNERIEYYVEKGIDEALATIKRRFEDASDEKDRLPFHGQRHTKDVTERTGAILEIIKKRDPSLLADRDMAIGRLAAAFHDVVQGYEESTVSDGEFQKTMRKRFIGENEKKSADEAIAFMAKTNQESGQEIFTSQDISTVREAIDVTVPKFDTEKKTVIQPNLNEKSSLIARVVALADLGTVGTNPKAFIREGSTLFREENLDILDAMKDLSNISSGKKEFFRKRMLNGLKSQSQFAQGRKELLNKELEDIPEQARQEVARLFNKFDLSIQASGEVAKKGEGLSFEELASDMGYELAQPSGERVKS